MINQEVERREKKEQPIQVERNTHWDWQALKRNILDCLPPKPIYQEFLAKSFVWTLRTLDNVLDHNLFGHLC